MLSVSSSVRTRALSPAESLFHTGELQLQLGRTDEAERRFRHALDLEPDGADALAGLAAVRDLQSRLEEAGELFEEAVDLGSSYTPTFFRWGRHELARLEAAAAIGDETGVLRSAAAARDAFRRAVALDPGFAEARALLGVAHLYGDVDPRRGIAYLGQAIRSLPSRPDLVYHLLQLLLRVGDLNRAERVVATDLALRGEPELLWRARQDVERAALLRDAEAALEQGDRLRATALLDQAISKTDDERLRSDLEERLRILQTAPIQP
jgi:tetratricopeptide (TPR) repeat protein